MDIHSKTIHARVEWLLELARKHSASYCSPETFLARERYLAEHPTAIVVLKCMDGRINIPVATNTPPGIIQPIRNLGGMFNLGWPHLGEVLANHVHERVSTGRRVLMLITYHFSKGDKHRGCAGFCYRHRSGDCPHLRDQAAGRAYLRLGPWHGLSHRVRFRNRRGCAHPAWQQW